VRTSTTASARVSRQCVISLELVDPKDYLKRVNSKGKLVNIPVPNKLRYYLYGHLPDRGSITIVVSKCSRFGECRNDENHFETLMALR
jgi:hypothetical protein